MVTRSRSLPGEIAAEEDFDFEAPKEYLANDVTLVFDHTHRPFNYQNIINLGSWITNCPVHSIYLETKGVQEKLKIFPNDEVPRETISSRNLNDILNH